MMIKTKYLGDIEINEDKIITFDEGIMGFPELKKYILMETDIEESPFFWLQSIENVDIKFPIIDVSKFIGDYYPLVDNAEIDKLGKAEDEELAVYNIAVIPKNIEELRVNLKAPVVINLNNLKAKQIISNDERHPVKYYLYKELKKLKAGE